jgi:hypothetical protein
MVNNNSIRTRAIQIILCARHHLNTYGTLFRYPAIRLLTCSLTVADCVCGVVWARAACAGLRVQNVSDSLECAVEGGRRVRLLAGSYPCRQPKYTSPWPCRAIACGREGGSYGLVVCCRSPALCVLFVWPTCGDAALQPVSCAQVCAIARVGEPCREPSRGMAACIQQTRTLAHAMQCRHQQPGLTHGCLVTGPDVGRSDL